jgi:hypothetical protein
MVCMNKKGGETCCEAKECHNRKHQLQGEPLQNDHRIGFILNIYWTLHVYE